MHNKAVQTVCAGFGADLSVPIRPDASLTGSIKQESPWHPSRDVFNNQAPYLHALKLGRASFHSHHDYSIRSSCLQTGTRYGRFIHEEKQANGGGLILHAYADELACLSPAEMECFAQEFLELAFAEKPRGAAVYALSVVHRAAAYLPDFLDYFAFNFPNTPVKVEILGKKDIETTTISNFHSQVCGRGKKLHAKTHIIFRKKNKQQRINCQPFIAMIIIFLCQMKSCIFLSPPVNLLPLL